VQLKKRGGPAKDSNGRAEDSSVFHEVHCVVGIRPRNGRDALLLGKVLCRIGLNYIKIKAKGTSL
jgi:hypothetical protein